MDKQNPVLIFSQIYFDFTIERRKHIFFLFSLSFLFFISFFIWRKSRGVINRTFYLWKITNNKGYTWMRSETHNILVKTLERRDGLGDTDLDKIGCKLVNWVQLFLKRDQAFVNAVMAL
jgi:hypothetical protein